LFPFSLLSSLRDCVIHYICVHLPITSAREEYRCVHIYSCKHCQMVVEWRRSYLCLCSVLHGGWR
jgi:hypothetical protein